MSRLTGKAVEEVQSDRVATARDFAAAVHVHVVLKGNRTLIAEPNVQVLVNPTGSPAMATGGTGDILTGLAAGLIAQFDGSPEQIGIALAAAVYLHGLAGELGAKALGEQCLIATDLLDYLSEAIGTVRKTSDR
jgi:NAD(P)H-hydrate epimerase